MFIYQCHVIRACVNTCTRNPQQTFIHRLYLSQYKQNIQKVVAFTTQSPYRCHVGCRSWTSQSIISLLVVFLKNKTAKSHDSQPNISLVFAKSVHKYKWLLLLITRVKYTNDTYITFNVYITIFIAHFVGNVIACQLISQKWRTKQRHEVKPTCWTVK